MLNSATIESLAYVLHLSQDIGSIESGLSQ